MGTSPNYIVAAEKSAVEHHRNPIARIPGVRLAATFGMDVQMRFGCVPGIAYPAQRLSLPHTVANRDQHAVRLHMGEEDLDSLMHQQDMIPGGPRGIGFGGNQIGQVGNDRLYHAVAGTVEYIVVDTVAVQPARIDAAGPPTKDIQFQNIDGVPLAAARRVVIDADGAPTMRHGIGAVAQGKGEVQGVRRAAVTS